MRKTIFALCAAICISITSKAQVTLKLTKPLSKPDMEAVTKILADFDPNSYKFSGTYVDENNKTKPFRAGLASIRQTNTRVVPKGNAASTNTHNNIFKTASTNTHNNIFKTASTNTHNNIFKASTNTHNNVFKASTNTHNNIFKSGPDWDNKLNQLYNILAKYQ